jgi:hypothetical protein
MKPGFFKREILILTLSLFMLSSSWAQTVLVHSPGTDGEDENLTLQSQSAESGIMDVLFDRGFIIFSDSSDADEEGQRSMAAKVGCEYVLSWELSEGGVTGRLINLKGASSAPSAVGEGELDGLYSDAGELYAALGGRLCESLVGEVQ